MMNLTPFPHSRRLWLAGATGEDGPSSLDLLQLLLGLNLGERLRV
jgi:hypothetical protein